MQRVRGKQAVQILLLLLTLGMATIACAQGENTTSGASPVQAEAGGDPAERPALTLKIEGVESPGSMDVALKIVLFIILSFAAMC